jgi:TrmH family RNA methyltransferase
MAFRKDKRLSRIRIVVIEPVAPGNVGSIARAMANFGIEDLVLVSPLVFDMKVARSFACNGGYIIESLKTADSFEEAVKGVSVVVGMTRRAKEVEVTVPVEKMAEVVLYAAASSDVAIVFGRERSGLSAEEKDRCTVLSHIDSVAGAAGSLNIAHAALLSMHEIFRETTRGKPPSADIESLFESFDRFCSLQKDYASGGMIQQVFRSVVSRAMVSGREVKRLKTFFEKCRKSMA